MLMMVSMMGCNNKHSVKKYKFVRDLKTGENICSKRMRISRVPCGVPGKMLILVERKQEKYQWFRVIKYIHCWKNAPFDDVPCVSELI